MTSTGNAISIPDYQTGCAVLAQLPLANPAQAEVDLNAFLDGLMANPPEGDAYFLLLEQTRAPLSFVGDELVKGYVSKPLPLADFAESLFQRVLWLWLKAAQAYAHCAQHLESSDANPPDALLATILHRCIHYSGLAILEYHRARRELTWGLWLDLHGYYASAEEWGVASLPVPDALDASVHNTHCAAAYISFLLCDMVGSYSLSVRDQALVRRWANTWAPLVSLHPAQPGDSLPNFVVDLMQDTALRPLADCLKIEQIRRLDTSRLAIHIRLIRQQLAEKISPAQLDLGDDCSAGQCSRLLEQIAHPWSQVRNARKFRRHSASGNIRLCTGFEEMHFFISGMEFEQPDNVRNYSRREYDSLYAFRHQADPTQLLHVRKEQLNYQEDVWEVVNQSANGFRLVRSLSGKQLAHCQLVALCPFNGESYFLGQAVWLIQEQGGGLIAGIKALPGMPMAVSARLLDANGKTDAQYARAFLLPEVEAVNSPQSLILPHGWFRSDRIIEILTGSSWQAQLQHVVDDGPDFERVSFRVC